MFASLRLLRSRRVGSTTWHRLIGEHGSAAAALDALPEIAKAAGAQDYRVCPDGVIEAELRAARAARARPVLWGAPDYPLALTDLDDAPPFLWTLGDISLLQRPMIAMVGARDASSLGLRMARRLAHDLSEAGFVVVSGLARGIDAAAHAAALENGTVAVQAGGVDTIYPTENADLAHAIADRGLRLSEAAMGLQPQARHFPARNRIISGLARAVVVVEAASRSGSLITARNALDQNREVLAVPGHPFDARASGCNMLIRDGAALVRSAQDVIEAIGPAADVTADLFGRDNQRSPARTERPARQPDRTVPPGPLDETPSEILSRLPAAEPRSLDQAAALHARILDRLSPSPLAEDQLIRDLSARPNQIAPALVDLELDGKIARQPGGMLVRLT